MVFCNGINFALRSGDEHRQLRLNSSQIELVEKSGERSYLKYVEDISKNRPGGIKGRKIKPKVVYHYANTTRSEWCFVRLYKKYVQLCPRSTESNGFYLQPSKKPTATCWSINKPVGHNTLQNTCVKTMQSCWLTMVLHKPFPPGHCCYEAIQFWMSSL